MTAGVGGADFATELAGRGGQRDAVPPIGAEEHGRRVARAHGIGLDMHAAPCFAGGDRAPLAPGNTGSIEPRLAIHGAFGIRIEDHFVVTESDAAWLTEPARPVDDPFGME